MAATPFQSGILRLLAARRRAAGESYVAGKCLITTAWELFHGGVEELDKALRDKAMVFHEGRIGGSWPTIKGDFGSVIFCKFRYGGST